jgi:hypothetical protein
MKINLNHKTFTSLLNSKNGEVTAETLFHYRQKDHLVWAEYAGGDIVKGFLIGQFQGAQLDFEYQHLNRNDELMTGKCTTTPEIQSNGKIILHEKWQWTCKDFSSGESTLIEV